LYDFSRKKADILAVSSCFSRSNVLDWFLRGKADADVKSETSFDCFLSFAVMITCLGGMRACTQCFSPAGFLHDTQSLKRGCVFSGSFFAKKEPKKPSRLRRWSFIGLLRGYREARSPTAGGFCKKEPKNFSRFAGDIMSRAGVAKGSTSSNIY